MMVAIRYILAIIAAVTIAWLTPIDLITSTTLTYTTVFFLFAFIVAFMIDRTIDQQRILRDNLNIELSRLRRIHHLAENIGTTTWRAKLDESLTLYQLQLSEQMGEYEETTASFRDVSHQVYSFTPKNIREQVLMDDLLETLRELSLGRQYISSGLKSTLDAYQWGVLIAQTMLMALVIITSQVPVIGPRLGVAAALLSVVLAVEMLLYSNTFPESGLRRYQKQYQKNIPVRQEPAKRHRGKR